MSDTVLVALISGGVSILINLGTKYLDHKNGMSKDIKDIKADISELKSNDIMNGDMIYQMLDHMATENNSGEMRRALNEYNAFHRHG